MSASQSVTKNGHPKVLLEVNKLTRVFGSGAGAVTAVNAATFSVAERQVVAIVGESGSGKSTMARMLLRLMEPTSGTFSLDGMDATKLKGRALKTYWQQVQAVFQDPFSSFNQFFPIRRLLDNATGVIKGLSQTERKQRMEEALNHVGLTLEVLDKYPHTLSGGQRQRIMMARALMLRPRLLIADEATSMLDASVRANILNLLGDIRRDLGMTVLFVTHDLGQASYVSDYMLVMYKGNLVEQGTTEEVLWNPKDDYTKRLLADVPKLHAIA
ncbi:MAG TPA: ATP-binding cassette domain-containing protein [Gemmatimonadales bacterium]